VPPTAAGCKPAGHLGWARPWSAIGQGVLILCCTELNGALLQRKAELLAAYAWAEGNLWPLVLAWYRRTPPEPTHAP
jgi:hypothetical protein